MSLQTGLMGLLAGLFSMPLGVALAFDAFLGRIGEETPIVLAGHSQGARHLLELILGMAHHEAILALTR